MIRFVLLTVFLAVSVATLAPHGSRATPDAAAVDTMTPDSATPVAPPPSTFAAARELVLDRAPDGHFYTDAQVGTATIHFLVDTGASTIALSRTDAQAAGVQYMGSDRGGTAQTAGGEVGFKAVKLDRVAIGPFEGRDIDAAVIDTPMGVSLLGQSWLRKVGTVTISGDRMTLK